MPEQDNRANSKNIDNQNYSQIIKNERFLRELSFSIAELDQKDDPYQVLLKRIKEFTGASLAVFSYYDDIKKVLKVQVFDADSYIVKTIIGIAGDKITQTESPVNPSTYNRILNEKIGISDSFSEVSFGAIPDKVDKVIKRLTGITKLYGIAHVLDNVVYGTTMIAFKKGIPLPPIELLQSYSNLSAITLKRKKAELQSAQNERKVRQLLELAPDAFFQGNLNGDLILVNNKAAILTGYSKEELLQINMKDLFTEDELNKKPLRYDLIDKGATVLAERQIHRKDGISIFVEMNSQKNPDGTYQSFMRDISERKEFERQLTIAKEKS